MQEPISNPNELHLGHLAGLRLTASNSALIGSGFLWISLSALAAIFLRMMIIEAVALGLFAVILHWIGNIAHQLGHARAARASGHPMVGIRLWGLLSSSIYPADEPPLPAQGRHPARARRADIEPRAGCNLRRTRPAPPNSLPLLVACPLLRRRQLPGIHDRLPAPSRLHRRQHHPALAPQTLLTTVNVARCAGSPCTWPHPTSFSIQAKVPKGQHKGGCWETDQALCLYIVLRGLWVWRRV